MDHIEVKQLIAAKERIERQVLILRQLCQGTIQADENIKYMTYIEETRRNLRKSREAIEESIRVLSLMAEVLKEAAYKYQKTEEKIVDRYNLDVVIYPEIRIGTSRIKGLEEYQLLMPF